MERAGILMADGAARDHFRSMVAQLGYDTVVYGGLTQLLRGGRRDDMRLLFVDVDQPEDDWAGVIAQLHESSPSRAVVVGIGAAALAPTVALDAGADEFVALPCRAQELGARVQAALRRVEPSRGAAEAALRCGPCALDVTARKLVALRGSVELTSRETALARCLFQTVGGIVSRRRLAHIWEAEEDIAGRSIDQHVYQLRRKLKRCVGDAVVLRSVYARGYQLEALVAG